MTPDDQLSLMEHTFATPPHTLNDEGLERKIGFEFEFTGVEMHDVAETLAKLYGGIINQISTYEFEISGGRFGTFKLELDAQLFLNKKYEKLLKSIGVNVSTFKNKEAFENILKELASTVVPFEIITPPLPLSSIHELNTLVEELRLWKAKGTGSSVFYAFGMHINPEAPSLSADSLLRHLKAYVLLDPWIRINAETDLSRKLSPYINEYEIEYIRLILHEGYEPDLNMLIRNYFQYKNSRNRALDMVPLFMFLKEKLVRDLFEEDKLTSARPTYHYRLPNCSLENVNWSLAKEWNRWVLVEKLAEDRKALDQYSRAFLKMDKEAVFSAKKKWVKLMDRWVQNV